MSENVGAPTSRNPKGLHGLYRDSFTFIPYTTPGKQFTHVGHPYRYPLSSILGVISSLHQIAAHTKYGTMKITTSPKPHSLYQKKKNMKLNANKVQILYISTFK
jgi:hypothetical protein